MKNQLTFEYWKAVREYYRPEDYATVVKTVAMGFAYPETKPTRKPRRETRWYFHIKSANGEAKPTSASPAR